MATPSLRAPSDHDSVGALVARLGEDVGRIVRTEIALVQTRAEAIVGVLKAAGVLLGLGAVLAVVGVGALAEALIFGLVQWLAPWLAALVVGFGLVMVAIVILALQTRVVSAGVAEALAPEERLVREEVRYGN